MPNRRRRARRLLATVLVLQPLAAASSPISDRLDAMVREMTDAFTAKRPQRGGDSLAVFTFETDEQLAKRRVGFAVSELLLQRFVNARKFVVVERTALERVLKEQALGLTGAVDPDTAVKVGRVIGAHNLVLGRVDKLGGKYQVNARMIEADTGEVVASSYQEMDAGLFESEAQPYLLALVPEREALGLFVFGGYGLLGITQRTPGIFAGTIGSVSYSAVEDISRVHAGGPTFGIGGRYFPLPGLMAEWVYRPYEELVQFDDTITPGGDADCPGCKIEHQKAKLSGSGGALSLFWIRSVSRTRRIMAGVAVVLQHASMFDPTVTNNESEAIDYSKGGQAAKVYYRALSRLTTENDDAFTVIRPALRTGIEWKPQQRLGLGVIGTWFPLGTTVTYYRNFSDYGISGSSGTITQAVNVPVISITLPVFVVESTMTFYF